MNHRLHALLAGAGLLVFLTGCGAQQSQNAVIELSPITPTRSASAAGASSSASPADTAACFDVAEVYSGLELLPLDQQGEGSLEGARAAVDQVRGKLPAAVRPAFDDVRTVLDDAGATLQPAEAVRIHRALEPAESWLQANCAGTPRH